MAYNIFITHAWKEDKEYDELKSWLERSPLADKIAITSDPDKSKLPDGADLRAALVEQINAADCVLLIENMFGSYSGWMMQEFLAAREARKRIILMKTLANTVKQRATVPMTVEGGVDTVSIWHERTILNLIKQGIIE